MNIGNMTSQARLYLRSEALIAEIKLRAQLRKFAWFGVAGALALMGAAFLNVAGYAWLVSLWGPVLTPLALGALNVALAAVALLVAGASRPGAELQMAEEMRGFLGSALEEEVQNLNPANFIPVGAAGGLASDVVLRKLLLPVMSSIFAALRRRKAEPPKKAK